VLFGLELDMPVVLPRIQVITIWETTLKRFKLILIPLVSHMEPYWISSGKAMILQESLGPANIGRPYSITAKNRRVLLLRREINLLPPQR
jgi:hypothetical protein